MSEKNSFRESLREARRTVDKWPEWKQRALGGGPSSVRRSANAEQASSSKARAPNKAKAD